MALYSFSAMFSQLPCCGVGQFSIQRKTVMVNLGGVVFWPETLSAVPTALEYKSPHPTGRCGPWR